MAHLLHHAPPTARSFTDTARTVIIAALLLLAAVVIQLTKKTNDIISVQIFFMKMLLDEICDLYTTYITLVMFLVIFSQKLQLQKQEI